VYRYGTRPGKWTQILQKTSEGHDQADVVEEPQPRYAHQVVYEEGSKTVFMHGGNAGLASGNNDGMERAASSSRLEDSAVDGDGVGSAKLDDGSEAQGQKEKRLDDFWSMTLER
jgi:hypothetical protein